jgi:putative hydrolase of the HAD superfamily
MMKVARAVLFDLYDTLASVPFDLYVQAKASMAALAGVPQEAFTHAWKRYTKPAALGEVRTVQERVRNVLAELGVDGSPALVAQIAAIEVTLQEERVEKLPGCDEALQLIKENGYLTALVTNTSIVAVRAVENLGIRPWFDALFFSFEHHLLKPDPLFYRKAAQELAIPPAECIFVGDGNDMELDGAQDAGMTAVRVGQGREASLSSRQSTRYDFTISSLFELFPLIVRINQDRGRGPG